MRSVDKTRWVLAQQGEARYWQAASHNLAEQSRILDEKIQALELARNAVPMLDRCEGPRVEIGIGPMGVGLLHYSKSMSSLIGVDPLPVLHTAGHWPRPFSALVQSCWQDYSHLRARGEQLPLASASTQLVACYNVLDHVQSPSAVLSEIYRILQPGGFLLLGCDTVSLASLLKFHTYAKWRARDSLAVICHPYHFLAPRLESLVRRAGFSILWARRRPAESVARLLGHAFRSLYVAGKDPLGGGNGCR